MKASQLREISMQAKNTADLFRHSNGDLTSEGNEIYRLCDAIETYLNRPDPLSQALNEGDGVYRP